MVQHARDLGEQDADPLAALRHLDAEQLLDAEHVGVLHAHRRDVVEPVEIRQRLQVGAVLDQLLGAAMQQPDMRVGSLHHLAVHLEHQPQDAVRGRVLRAEIDGVAVDLDDLPIALRLGVGNRDAHRPALPPGAATRRLTSASWRCSCTFSSPGSVVTPSQGLSKSKERHSCDSFTGSVTTRRSSSS